MDSYDQDMNAAAAEWTRKNRGSVNKKNSELERLWNLMMKISQTMTQEAKANPGRVTAYWQTLQRDQQKLKDEYEKLKGGGTYNPQSIKHGETMTRNKVVDAFLGRKGPDSHNSLENK
jgi:hypothetical protein